MKHSAPPRLALLVLAGLVVGGCTMPPGHPPQTVSELEQHRKSGKQEFPPRTIALHNVRRVLSSELLPEQRLESLKVVERVDSAELELYPSLATVLPDGRAPRALQFAALAFLAKKDYPGLGDFVAAALTQVTDPQLRTALLEWVESHPAGVPLADVVKLWAAEKVANEDSETRYRRIVERISGKPWDQALLDGLNAADFAARGSTIEILAARFRPEQLQQRIIALPAQSDTMRALQYLSDAFKYVPRTRRELLAAATLYRGGGAGLRSASELAEKWRADGYRFNIRDCHLMMRLSSDPLRKPMSRQQLTLESSRAIAGRRGQSPGGGEVWRQKVFRRGRLVDFDSQVEALGMPDLWNLFLLDEMLARPRLRQALQIMAERDRADKQTQWGGLITYEQGQAEAKLYPPGARRGDDQYVPSEAMMRDALASMCYFVGHFNELVTNPAWIGPTKQEMDFARDWNIPGLVLTSLEAGKMDAMYYSPEGIVIDLGEYVVGK